MACLLISLYSDFLEEGEGGVWEGVGASGWVGRDVRELHLLFLLLLLWLHFYFLLYSL